MAPDGGGGNPRPPANNPPVINSFSVQGTRAAEPANFADLGETVNVSANVRDDETAIAQLQFVWTASAGTFAGNGAAVTWTAPAQGATPVDVTISLKVVERFGNPGGPLSFENDTSGSTTLSLHDSAKEVGDMARQFLLEFSDSNLRDVSQIMRNFDPACEGTRAETDQVAANRRRFTIFRSTIGQPVVRVPLGNSPCPVPDRIQRGDACSGTPVHWESTQLSNGHIQIADGTDWIAAFYRPALKTWRLCDSQFTGTCVDTTSRGPCNDEALRALGGVWRRQ